LRQVGPRAGPPGTTGQRQRFFQEPHRELDVAALPSLLLPRKGRFGLIDYEKAFCAEATAPAPVGAGVAGSADIFELRGVDRRQGALVVARPDQVVANVLPLDAHEELADFFGRIFIDRRGPPT
jgi:phenol 2-monooxygenase